MKKNCLHCGAENIFPDNTGLEEQVCGRCRKKISDASLLAVRIEGYPFFDICPFTVAKVGGGGGIGFDVQSYTWIHSPCLKEHCRLWTYKFDDEKKVFAEGCSMQFMGLSNDEIKRNQEEKKRLAEGSPA
jgi:hypothetical protein